MGNVLGRDAIFAAKSKVKTQAVDIPEWEGEILVRELDVDKIFAMRQRLVQVGQDHLAENVKLWVIYAACDAELNPIFDDTPETMAALGQLSGVVLNRISDAAIELNVKKKEELVKNLEASPNGNSSSN